MVVGFVFLEGAFVLQLTADWGESFLIVHGCERLHWSFRTEDNLEDDCRGKEDVVSSLL